MEQIFAEKYVCKNWVIAAFTWVILGKLSSSVSREEGGNRQQREEIRDQNATQTAKGGVFDKLEQLQSFQM